MLRGEAVLIIILFFLELMYLDLPIEGYGLVKLIKDSWLELH
jgi:hypothetical protein